MQAIAGLLAVRRASETRHWAWVLLSIAFALLVSGTGYLLYQAHLANINLGLGAPSMALGASAAFLASMLVLSPQTAPLPHDPAANANEASAVTARARWQSRMAVLLGLIGIILGVALGITGIRVIRATLEASAPESLQRQIIVASIPWLAGWALVILGILPLSLALLRSAYLHERSARAQALESARESEMRFRTVIDSGMIGIAMLDEQGRVDDANDEFLRIAGVKCEDLGPKRLVWRDLVPTEHHPAIEHAIQQSSHGGRCVPFEAELDRKSGGRVAVLVGAVSMKDRSDAGGLLFLDITEHKRAEQALIARERRFRALIDNASDAIALVDQSGKILYASPATRQILGYDAADVVGRILFDVAHDDDRHEFATQLGKLVRSPGAELKLHVRMRHSDGTYRMLEAMFKNMRRDPSVGAIVMNYHDITEHNRAEDELRTSNRMQQLLLRELNHRVRNNLAGLISLIEMSAGSASDIPTLATTIRNRVHSMAAVHGMLSHTSWSSVPLEEMIHKLLPHGRHGKVDVHGPHVEIPAHQCTPMGMVIGELMANSLKYGALAVPDGHVEISWRFVESDRVEFVAVELTWEEHGGPPIDHVPSPGLGTSLISGFVRSDLRGEATLEYPRQGAHHRFLIRLDRVHQPVGITE